VLERRRKDRRSAGANLEIRAPTVTLQRSRSICAGAALGCSLSIAAPKPSLGGGPGREGRLMKYMITWNERSQGSAIEYEKAQQRILDVFRRWEARANFKIELFVIRVGDWGGHMLADCDDPVTVHKFCSMLRAFEFQARPVILIEDAVRGELEVMVWRDNL
jgi:hypothetical protein